MEARRTILVVPRIGFAQDVIQRGGWDALAIGGLTGFILVTQPTLSTTSVVSAVLSDTLEEATGTNAIHALPTGSTTAAGAGAPIGATLFSLAIGNTVLHA